jgi:hypothetical protein
MVPAKGVLTDGRYALVDRCATSELILRRGSRWWHGTDKGSGTSQLQS